LPSTRACGNPKGENMENFLIKQETYLEAGIHIGTRLKVIDMDPFIYRRRNDGLYVLDLRKIDERIRLAGKILAKYESSEILVVASRTYSGNAASTFSKLTGINAYYGRFIPGILTNVHRDDFKEPKLLLVCDPKGERQAVVEAGKMGISTIGLCDTDNITMFIDLAVPCNNKGRRSLALIFYLLAREYMMGRNRISSYDEFTATLPQFEEEQEPEDETEKPAGKKSEQKPVAAKPAEKKPEQKPPEKTQGQPKPEVKKPEQKPEKKDVKLSDEGEEKPPQAGKESKPEKQSKS